jgi:hypothetical protein
LFADLHVRRAHSIQAFGDLLAGRQMDEFPSIVVRNYSGFADAFKAAKNHLNLSNEFAEQLGGLCTGHIDKTLGMTRNKGIGRRLFDILCELFAVEFVMRVNPEALQRMQKRWEGRNRLQVRIPPSHPISAEMLERAKKVIFSELGRKGAISAAKARRRARRNGHSNGHAP